MFKAQVRKAFNQAAPTYDSEAIIQRQIASLLLEQVDAARITGIETLVDLGSGTGWTQQALASIYPESDIIQIDLADQMLLQSQHTARVCADIESLPLADHSVDLIYSNLSMQWLSGLQQSLKECYRILSQQGQFHFTSLGPGTFSELYEVTQKPAIHYPTTLQWQDALHQLGFNDIELQCYPISDQFDSFAALIRHLKLVGAHTNQHRSSHLLTQRHMDALEQRYYQNSQGNTLPLTYQVIQGIARV